MPAASPSRPDRTQSQLLPFGGQDQLTLRGLVELLWHDKWLVLIMTVVFALGASLAAWMLPRWYDATILVSPEGHESGGGLGGLSSIGSQFGGLASLAGIVGAGDTEKAEYIAVLKSDAITERYIRDNNLLPVLYAAKWDASKREWRVRNAADVPTLWKATQYFEKRIRSVSKDEKTGLVSLTITWTDPAVAAAWANGLVKLTNDYLRDKALQRSHRDIDYLNAQAAQTQEVGVRETIYTLLESEIDKAMIAQGSDEYAFKVLDPAIAPEKPSFPRPLLWTALGVLCGGVLATLVVLIRAHWRRYG